MLRAIKCQVMLHYCVPSVPNNDYENSGICHSVKYLEIAQDLWHCMLFFLRQITQGTVLCNGLYKSWTIFLLIHNKYLGKI